MDKVRVRDARPEDARTVAEIHIAAWRAAYRELMPADYLASLSVNERADMWTRSIIRGGPSKLAIAEVDGALAGFCSFGPTRDELPDDFAEIYAINVAPERWRLGAGRALCEHALRQAALREHKTMSLWVVKGNDPARRFYERLGYRPDGAERANSQLVPIPFDEVRYRRLI